MAMKINLREGERVFYTENGESDTGKVLDVALKGFTDPDTDVDIEAGSVLVKWDNGDADDWYFADQLTKL